MTPRTRHLNTLTHVYGSLTTSSGVKVFNIPNLIPDISNLRTLSFSLVYLFNFTKNEIRDLAKNMHFHLLRNPCSLTNMHKNPSVSYNLHDKDLLNNHPL